MKLDARYLGDRVGSSGNAAVLRHRYFAAASNLLDFQRAITCTRIPRACRVVLLKGCVVPALLQDLDSLVLTQSELQRLESRLVRFARLALQGRGPFFRASSDEIRCQAGISTVASWLRCRRLRWFWTMVCSDNQAVLAALVGTSEFLGSPVDETGGLTSWATPWLRQLWEDASIFHQHLGLSSWSFQVGWQVVVSDWPVDRIDELLTFCGSVGRRPPRSVFGDPRHASADALLL